MITQPRFLENMTSHNMQELYLEVNNWKIAEHVLNKNGII